MVLLAQTEDKVLGEILNRIATTTGITRTSPGGKARALSEAVSEKLGDLYRYNDVSLIQAFLPGAQGEYLDFFGELLNIPRLEKVTASVYSRYKNVKFYVSSGTFGDINNHNPIVLSSGTIISTFPGATGVKYKLLSGVILPATSSSFYVSAQSLIEGAEGNIGKGELKYHNSTSYVDYLNNSLFVTNDAEITSGQGIEGDENYRYRLSNSLTAAERANRIAIRLAILSIPGIADYVEQPYARGVGSFDIVLKSTTPMISNGLIATVQDAVDITAAHGIVGTIKGPKEIGLSLTVSIKLSITFSAAEQQQLVTSIQSIIADYVNNLDIGQPLYLNQIVGRIMNIDNRITNVGTNSKPFDSVYIYTPTKLQDNKVRTELINDYMTGSIERVIIETEEVSGDPITVIIL